MTTLHPWPDHPIRAVLPEVAPAGVTLIAAASSYWRNRRHTAAHGGATKAQQLKGMQTAEAALAVTGIRARFIRAGRRDTRSCHHS
jgi:hypothetical protein